jgi:hypothetical protein
MTQDDMKMFQNYVSARVAKVHTVISENLDAVGQEDADINNDGVVNKQDEYLQKRRAAVSAAIKSKEESEEADVMQSHYNVNHEALDLCDHLLTHPKKYKKGDIMKIIQTAQDHLSHKDEAAEMATGTPTPSIAAPVAPSVA